MGLFDYFRRRRERESAMALGQVTPVDPAGAAPGSEHASIAAAISEANSGGAQSVPTPVHDAFRYSSSAPIGSPVQGMDYQRLQELQASVLEIMKEHGIDPMRPDPSKFMDPDLQRALQDAVARAGITGGGWGASSAAS